MMLVVATHAAIAFMVTPIGWAIQDRSQHIAVDGYVWLVRAFVMPAFFWLSGYFSRALFEHGGARGFARHRVLRIVVPLAVGLVPCSLASNALWDWGRDLAGRAAVAANVPKLEGSGLPVSLGHLWYLYYLLAISALAVAVVAISRRLRLAPSPPTIVVLAAVVATGVLAASRALQLDTPLGFNLDPGFLAFHAAFFAWGWVVHAHPPELERYAARAWRFVACIPLLILPLAEPLYASADPARAAPPPLYASLASGALSLALVASFIGLCTRFARRPSPVLRLASEASYWTYVAHFPLVVLLQLLLADLPLPWPLKLLAILAATSAACLATYELLVRRTPLRRLLG